MTLITLIGAVLGSGAAIAFGRAPAEKLLVRVQAKLTKRR
jgi:hypothetical protein